MFLEKVSNRIIICAKNLHVIQKSRNIDLLKDILFLCNKVKIVQKHIVHKTTDATQNASGVQSAYVYQILSLQITNANTFYKDLNEFYIDTNFALSHFSRYSVIRRYYQTPLHLRGKASKWNHNACEFVGKESKKLCHHIIVYIT